MRHVQQILLHATAITTVLLMPHRRLSNHQPPPTLNASLPGHCRHTASVSVTMLKSLLRDSFLLIQTCELDMSIHALMR